MINLFTFFKNHFDTKDISNARLIKFAQSHLQRLHANNPSNAYDTMIANTTAALTAYVNALAEEDSNFSTQQALTKQTDDFFKKFKRMVSQKEGMVRAMWGIDSPEYGEFFPQGLTEYAQAVKANVPILMQRIVVKAQKYEADLGMAFLTLFTDLQTNYANARTAQLNSIGNVAGDKTFLHESRFALTVQLMNNLLLLAADHIGNPDRGMDYFDQSIIQRSQGSTA